MSYIFDMNLQGGPYWNVPTGRRDGTISKAADVFITLPAPFNNLTTLLTLFGNVGLDANDLVLLSAMLIIMCFMLRSFYETLTQTQDIVTLFQVLNC